MADYRIYCNECKGEKPGFYYKVKTNEEGYLIQDYIQYRKNFELNDEIVKFWAKKYNFTEKEVMQILLDFIKTLEEREIEK